MTTLFPPLSTSKHCVLVTSLYPRFLHGVQGSSSATAPAMLWTAPDQVIVVVVAIVIVTAVRGAPDQLTFLAVLAVVVLQLWRVS